MSDEMKELLKDYLDGSHDYVLTVTESQYKLIIYALELASRLESGQLKELIGYGGPIRNLTQSGTSRLIDPPNEVLEPIIDRLKNKIGLMSNQSIGIRQSTERARELYEMYYLMKHHEAIKDPDSINVYKNKLMRVTDKPLIKIKEI